MSREANTGNIGTADWLIGTAKSNPEGLLLVAAGCALLMRSGRSRASNGDAEENRSVPPRSSSTRDQARGSRASKEISETAEIAREQASDLGSNAAATAIAYASSASEYAGEVRDTITEASGRVARRAQSTFQETVSRVVEEQPLTLALLGLAAGAAVAATFRATDIEKRTLGPAGERLTDSAERAGERLKESTVKAAERLRTAAEERGLNAEGLREVASDVTGAFGSALSGESAQSVPASSGESRRRSAVSDLGRSKDRSAKLDQSQRSGAPGSSKTGRPSGKRGA
jgi:hypothetical protein